MKLLSIDNLQTNISQVVDKKNKIIVGHLFSPLWTQDFLGDP